MKLEQEPEPESVESQLELECEREARRGLWRACTGQRRGQERPCVCHAGIHMHQASSSPAW